MESRVGILRLTPLMVCVLGARENSNAEEESKFIEIADILCTAGCRVNAKDTAGYNAAFHCTSGYSYDCGLGIFRLICHKHHAVVVPNRFNQYPLPECISTRNDAAIKVCSCVS